MSEKRVFYRYNKSFLILMILIIFSLNEHVSAQDANYWTHQYGSRSTLLGGAVIGSVMDLSGTYYNPGALSLLENPGVILAAKVFEYPIYTLEGSLFKKVQLNSSSIGPAPSLVATFLNFEWLGDHFLAFSFLIDQSEFTLGLGYSTGDETLLQSDSYNPYTLPEELKDRMSGATFKYRVYKFVLGLSI